MHRWRVKESHLCIANTLPLKHENKSRNPKHIIYLFLKGGMHFLCVLRHYASLQQWKKWLLSYWDASRQDEPLKKLWI